MKNRSLTATLLIIFTVVSVGPVLAKGKGNARKGKYLFRKHCRTCHVQGGQANEMSPIDRKQAEWEALFAKAGFPCQADWPELSEKDLKDIYSYLHGHASDSPSPAKCK